MSQQLQKRPETISSGSEINEKYKNPSESKDLAKLFEALAKAQMDMELAKTDKKNDFFSSNYADLASVVKASRPHLAKNGLSVSQRMYPSEQGELSLYTRLCHSSGQWMDSVMPISPPKDTIHALGSYITYLKRYNYASIVGVVASGEDDDGEKAMVSCREKSTTSLRKKSATSLRKNSTECLKKDFITKEQLEVLSGELEGYEEILESLLSGFKITKLSDLQSKRYAQCISRIREIKKVKEEVCKK